MGIKLTVCFEGGKGKSALDVSSGMGDRSQMRVIGSRKLLSRNPPIRSLSSPSILYEIRDENRTLLYSRFDFSRRCFLGFSLNYFFLASRTYSCNSIFLSNEKLVDRKINYLFISLNIHMKLSFLLKEKQLFSPTKFHFLLNYRIFYFLKS